MIFDTCLQQEVMTRGCEKAFEIAQRESYAMMIFVAALALLTCGVFWSMVKN